MDSAPALRSLRWPLACLALLALLACTEDHKPPPYTHDPIMMSYAELRASFAVEAPRNVVKNGKILRYGSLLFIVERYAGIHVIDNRDPTHPQRLQFLRIPGTVDMACKDGVLFADNTVDLVAIDIASQPFQLAKRIEGAFPWNPYQCVEDAHVTFPPDIYGYQSWGVVVGARPRR